MSLVIQKNLLTPRQESQEDLLCTNIFHTTCIVSGRVCKVIIDSGSCENVVPKEVVNKLKLKVENHPNPYKIALFKKGNEVTIDKCCLISLSIGN